MHTFIIRPGYSTGEPLIEFCGDHRATDFPSVIHLLGQQLANFSAKGSEPAPDDFLWSISYSGGEFEVSNDWGGLFILPKGNCTKVIADVSAALVASGAFSVKAAA